jgi:hypothetical protein
METTKPRKVTVQKSRGVGGRGGGEAGIFEQLPMGFRLLMVETQEPAGTCPSIRLTPYDDFLPP